VSCAQHHLSPLLCHDFLHPPLPDCIELWIIALQIQPTVSIGARARL